MVKIGRRQLEERSNHKERVVKEGFGLPQHSKQRLDKVQELLLGEI